MTPREHVCQRARDLGFDPDRLRSAFYRTHVYAVARREIAVELRSQGHSMPEIARALGLRNHTSVLWMLRGGRSKRTDPAAVERVLRLNQDRLWTKTK